MSKLAMTAVSATSMVAMSFLEPATLTFLTVIPPGFVVPVTKKSTAALLIKSTAADGDIKAKRALGAEEGSAAVTWTWRRCLDVQGRQQAANSADDGEADSCRESSCVHVDVSGGAADVKLPTTINGAQ